LNFENFNAGPADTIAIFRVCCFTVKQYNIKLILFCFLSKKTCIMVLFFLMQILTCAVLLIIHPFKSAQVVSFMVDCVIRIVTCPLFVRLITQRLWKRHLYVCDISCVRFMQSLEEGKERMLPYFKVDCFCLLPCMVSVKGLEFQFQLHFLVAARDKKTHSITLSIHKKSENNAWNS
jgi:hypothetical protein